MDTFTHMYIYFFSGYYVAQAFMLDFTQLCIMILSHHDSQHVSRFFLTSTKCMGSSLYASLSRSCIFNLLPLQSRPL